MPTELGSLRRIRTENSSTEASGQVTFQINSFSYNQCSNGTLCEVKGVSPGHPYPDQPLSYCGDAVREEGEMAVMGVVYYSGGAPGAGGSY